MIKLARYLKPHWWKIVIITIFLVIQAYLTLLLPDCMSKIASIVTEAQGSANYPLQNISGLEYFVPFVQLTGNTSGDIWIVGIYMIIISAAVLLTAVIVSLTTSSLSSSFGKAIRGDIFKKVNSFSIGEYEKFGTASLITRTTNDVEQVQQLVGFGLRIMIISPVTLVVAIIMIVTKDARLALIIAISIPIIIILVIVLLVFAGPLFKKIQEATDRVTLVLRESLTGVRVIRAFNQEETETEKFNNANRDMEKMIVKVGRVMSLADPIINILFNLTFIGIYFYGFSLVNNMVFDPKAQTAPDLSNLANVIASAQYAMQIMMAFLMLSFLLIMIPRATTCAKRINEILDTKNAIVDPENPIDPNTKIKGVVEFKNVTFTFPDASLPTLQNISFKTVPGSVTAIIGSTGSGKSSVINLIPRFFDVSSGSVMVDNIDVRNYSQKDLRNKIGFVPQQALLFKGTIKENMLFGNPNATDEEIKTAIQVAQSEHFISKTSNGINSEVSQGGKNFSGGQKQRLAIARALVKKPEVYIFDDSFSALDFKTDIKLRTALKEYTKESTVIIVAQRVSTIIDSDNIIVLNEGKIVGQGTHSELLHTCEVYKEIVFSQLDKDEIQKTINMTKQILKAEGGNE